MTLMRPSRVILTALVLLMVGCLDSATRPGSVDDSAPAPDSGMAITDAVPAAEPEATTDGPQPSLMMGNRTATGNEPLHFAGQQLTAPQLPAPEDAGCRLPACEQNAFQLALPPNYWVGSPGHLEVLIDWDFRQDGELDLRVLDAQGNVLARGQKPPYASEFKLIAERSISYATLVQLSALPGGSYQIQVEAAYGRTDYRATLQIEPGTAKPAGPPHDFLPNLVMLPPAELRVQGPPDPLTQAGTQAGISRGCSFEEAIEHQIERCLRFSSLYGNSGPGALELELPATEFGAAAQGSGKVFQNIERSDGTTRSVQAGVGEFHASHHHFHMAGIVRNALHEYDLDANTRGAPLTEARKLGFCFVDIGVVDPGQTGGPEIPAYGPMGCLSPLERGGLFMGISAGWYDLYWWSVADQFIDISHVPNGTYELVSLVNPSGVLHETTHADNEASVVFRLQGDTVTVLSQTGGGP